MDKDYEKRLLRQINFHNTSNNVLLPPSEDRGSFHSRQSRFQLEHQLPHDKHGMAYAALLKNELLGAGIEKVTDPQTEDRRFQVPMQERRNLFRYAVSSKKVLSDGGNEISPYSLSPLSNKSHKLLRSPRKPTRKISKIPFKVLDAPELQDDFYLNLVDWSASNVLSVGLGACVYLWSACTSQVGDA
ncbi:FZR1 protein, partial [Polypterus senegalus]